MDSFNDPNLSNLNLLTTPRWIATIPYVVADPNIKTDNYSFNLCEFELNENTTADANVSYLGYQFPVPVPVRNVNKTMTFNYLVDSALSQYAFLYKWFSNIVVEDGAGFTPRTSDQTPQPTNIYEGLMTTIRVIILTEFNNPVLELIYTDAWLMGLGKLSFSYQDPSAPVIKSSFTIKYGNLEFDWKPKPF
ncbi:MAG: hypothetical protein WCP55_07485 [Lentisphaerota bacterium]